MRSFFWVVLLFCLVALTACGAGAIKIGSSENDDDDGDEESAISVTIADADGSATISDPSSLTLTFDQDMEVASLTTPGNVALACGALTPSISVSSTSARVFSVAVADAYKYQLLGCTLTLTTNVRASAGIAAAKASGGTALAAPVTVPFTIGGCAVSDDFNSDTQSCWTVSTAGGWLDDWTTWSALIADGILTFDTASSDLDYANAELGVTGAAIVKTVAINAAGLQITLATDSVSGFTTATEAQPDMGYVAISGTDYATSPSLMVGFGKVSPDIPTGCFVAYYVPNPFSFNAATHDCSATCASSRCTIRVTVQNRIITAEYSTGSGAYQALTLSEGHAFPTNQDFSGMTELGLGFYNVGGTDSMAIDSVVVSGITSSTQY